MEWSTVTNYKIFQPFNCTKDEPKHLEPKTEVTLKSILTLTNCIDNINKRGVKSTAPSVGGANNSSTIWYKNPINLLQNDACISFDLKDDPWDPIYKKNDVKDFIFKRK